MSSQARKEFPLLVVCLAFATGAFFSIGFLKYKPSMVSLVETKEMQDVVDALTNTVEECAVKAHATTDKVVALETKCKEAEKKLNEKTKELDKAIEEYNGDIDKLKKEKTTLEGNVKELEDGLRKFKEELSKLRKEKLEAENKEQNKKEPSKEE